MSRTFAYLRVSTADQTTDNQMGEVRAAGFSVQSRRCISETISGSVTAKQRPGFQRLLDRLEEGDVLVVTKLDRLGRNAIDVASTVSELADLGVRVHCLQLGGVDLTSSTGKLTMGVINAVAEFERDLIVERTQAGLARAKAQGTKLGPRFKLTDVQKADVRRRLADKESVRSLAKAYGVSRQTIARVRETGTLCKADMLGKADTLGEP